MREPPSDQPPEEQIERSDAPSRPQPNRRGTEFFPFGLSAERFAVVTREMLKVARGVCRHSGVSPGDAVQQAFVKALSKPSTDRPAIENQEKFVAWMCELAKYEALTNRTAQQRRARREVDSTAEVSEALAVPPSVGAVEARKMLEQALLALAPAERELLHALYAEGKTVDDIAREQRLPWNTVDSRRRRLLDRLHALIRAATVALVVLLPRRARAFVAQLPQRATRMLVHMTQLGGAMTVTVVCGALLPAGSSRMTDSPLVVGLPPDGPATTILAQGAGLPPSVVPKVEPEEPKALDSATNPWLALDMKSAKIPLCLQRAVVPFAFLLAPAFTQVACTGTQQQTPPREPVEEYDEGPDDYTMMCRQERRRGNECPSREEWKHRWD